MREAQGGARRKLRYLVVRLLHLASAQVSTWVSLLQHSHQSSEAIRAIQAEPSSLSLFLLSNLFRRAVKVSSEVSKTADV